MLIERGTKVGSYQVEGILGRGGMGVVYSASHVNLDRRVALKVLSDDLTSSTEFVERFRREGRLQASLDHPHAVTVYEAGESEHGLFLAMQLVPGPTLALLYQERALDAARGLALLRQVGDALDAAHAAGLVHRDVKPQNVLVGESDDAYLGDFGLVRDGDTVGFTATGRLLGTIAYLAPEVIQGGSADPASDRYAFAAMTYECLTGGVVFPRGSEAAVLYAHTSEPPPRASNRRPELPPTLDDLFAKALAKEPAARPESARRLVDSVSAALEESDTEDLGPPPLWPAGLDATAETPVRIQAPAPAKRRRILPWVAAAAVAGAAVALGIGALVTDDAGTAGASVPPPLPGARVLGSDLTRPGRTLDCRGRTVHPTSPQCTIAQVALPGAMLVIPEDGVVRRWGVRSAQGEMALAFLRPRRGGASQYARSRDEFVGNDGVSMFSTDVAVERGDIVGLVVVGGSGVGARTAEGATTERWIPHVGVTRRPEYPPGTGFDNELLLRVELIPGAKQRIPRSVVGPPAARLPDGRVVARRKLHFNNGKPVEIDIVRLGSRYVIDEILDGVRAARMDVPGWVAGGNIITFHADPEGDSPDSVGIYLEYVPLESSRVLSHYYDAGDPAELDFVL
jgi:serine/threonine-protein kinase